MRNADDAMDAEGPLFARRPAGSALARAMSQVLAQAGVAVPRLAHGVRPDLGAIRALAVSGDQKRLALGGGTALVLEVHSGRCLAAFDHPQPVLSVALDRTGARLATACGERSARLWDVATAGCTRLAHEARVLSVYLDGGGRYLATGGDDGVASVFDVATVTRLLSVQLRRDPVRRVFLDDYAQWLLVEGPSAVDQWNVQTGEHVMTFRARGAGVHPRGSTTQQRVASGVASGVAERSALIWAADSGLVLRELHHPARVNDAYLHASGRWLATACADQQARLWDVETGTCASVLRGHSEEVTDVSLSPGADRLFTASADHTARLWDARLARCLRVYAGHGMPVIALALRADDGHLFVAGYGSDVAEYDLHTGRCVRRYCGHCGWVGALALSSDGRRLASAGHDGTARLWDTGSGQCLRTFEHRDVVHAVCFDRGDRTLFTAGRERNIRQWDIGSGRCLRVFAGHLGVVRCLALHPQGATLVAGDEAGQMRWWDVASGQSARTVAAHEFYVHSVGFSADGQSLYSAGDDGRVRRWSAGDEHCLATYTAGAAGVRPLCLGDDDAHLAAGGFDGAVTIWDIRSGNCRLKIEQAHDDWVRAVLFMPGRERLISGSRDGRIHFWDTRSGERLATLHNLQQGFLWTTPACGVAPHGWLWTDREDLIQVAAARHYGDPGEPLAADDPRRRDYLGTYNSQREVLRRLDLSGAAADSRLAQLTAIRHDLGRAETERLRLQYRDDPDRPR